MADEAVPIRPNYDSCYAMDVADNANIKAGEILKFDATNERVQSRGTSAGTFAGIAMNEKVSGDGKLVITVCRRGLFKFVSTAAVNAGDFVNGGSTKNKVTASTAVTIAALKDRIGVMVKGNAQAGDCIVEVGGA